MDLSFLSRSRLAGNTSAKVEQCCALMILSFIDKCLHLALFRHHPEFIRTTKAQHFLVFLACICCLKLQLSEAGREEGERKVRGKIEL